MAQSTLVVMPTGCGKTIVFGHAARDWNWGRVMILAHREELIFQAAQKVGAVCKEQCGIEMADLEVVEKSTYKQRVVVSSVQTLNSVRRGTRRMEKFDPLEFGLLIIDEAHHATAASYRRIVDWFGRNPDLRLLGVTATPDRADEEALGQVFESVAFEYGISDAVSEGWLVPIEQQFVHVEGLDLSQCRSDRNDLKESDVARIMEQEAMLHKVVSPTIELAGDKPTLLFCASVEQAHKSAEIFNRHKPQSAIAIDGTTDKEQRRDELKRFSRGEFQYLCNCGVFLEGFDEPRIAVVAMARPTKSRALYAQAIGRGTRPLPGVVDGLDSNDARLAAILGSDKPCIAEGQLVLTDHGLVKIEAVTTAMKVWDGLEFVSHYGSVFRGEKDTITYLGLTATVDHEVWTQEGWKAFGECAKQQIPISVAAFGRQKVWEADGVFRGNSQSQRQAAIVDGMRGLQCEEFEGLRKCDAEEGWMPEVRQPTACSEVACATGSIRETAVRESQGRALSPIRRTRDQIQIQVAAGNGDMGSGKSWPAQEHVSRQKRQRWPLLSRQLALCESIAADLQSEPTQEAAAADGSCVQAGASRDQICRRDASLTDFSGADRRSNNRAVQPEVQQAKRRVWDILNCGPRHRFTVEGLLVSNCMLTLDFVGNSGRHKLVCTADILGGNESDEVVDRAAANAKEKSARGQRSNMTDELEEAKKQLEEEARERKRQEAARIAKLAGIKAAARFNTKSVNPFDVFDIIPKREPGWFKGKKPTEKQKATLAKFKVDSGTIEGLSFWQASQMLDTLIDRVKKGYCSVRQAKILSKYGESTEVSFAEASAKIDAIAKNNWQPLTRS